MHFSETCVCVLFVVAVASAWNKRDDDDEGRSWKRTLAKQCRAVCKECYKEKRGQPLSRVCGTDNKTYKNICLMLKASCEKRKSIDVVFEGSCKRKTKIASRRGETVDSESESSEQSRYDYCLEIQLQCPRYLLRGQVCGSDRRTYSSECELEKAKCNGAAIERAYKGRCFRVRTDPTTTTTHAPTTSSCHRQCFPGERVVCGTDGVTYMSECHLRVLSCRAGRQVDVLYYEPCRRKSGGGTGGGSTGGNNPAPATTLRTPTTRKTTTLMTTTAVTSTAPATTVPPPTTTIIPTTFFPEINPADDPTEGGPCPNSCPDEEWLPVCGTDGKTYESQCHLRYEACTPSTPDVSVEYMGECVEDVDCGTCTALKYEPACGTDGITYYNKCELERYACFTNTPAIQLSHYGACVEEPSSGCPTNCPEPDDHEVCGTDGNTYPSLCHLTRRSCLHDGALALSHPGPCRIVTIDPCRRRCPFTYSPVCGSDGTTYFNGCFFEVAKCRNSNLQGTSGSCGLRIS